MNKKAGIHRRAGPLGGALVLALAVALGARPASGNGAFPDSLNILTPADRPHEILLSTNFGLVTSEDDGQTWTWTCEQDINAYALSYQLGAPPRHRLYALANGQLIFTDDGACTWKAGAGALSSASAVDAFPDPTDAMRVLAIGVPMGDAVGSYTVFESLDAGATFPNIRYTATGGANITGVEIARSDAATVYLTIVAPNGATFLPGLVHSPDRGASWMPHDLSGALGSVSVRLILVDPVNPLHVFLRAGGANGERLVVSDDGGVSVRTALTLAGGIMNAFVRMASGTIIVSGIVGVTSVLYRSSDGGNTFQPLPTPPNFRGLAERGGVLYGTADNVNDGFAIGTSRDQGMTWQALMRYSDIQAIDTCLKTQCQDICHTMADATLWPDTVCSATPQPRPIMDASTGPEDASATGSGGSGGGGKQDAGGPGGGNSGTGGAAGSPPPSSGCHCGTPGAPAASLTLLLAAALLLRRAARGRRR